MDNQQANAQTRAAWDCNAAFWDARMGEGNDFVNILCWPNLEKLLEIRPGMQILDAACGNGLIARRIAALGASVTAFDFSIEMLKFAKERTSAGAAITYQMLDACDEAALLTLGTGRFDAAVSNMALFDMADIDPLFKALQKLLKPGGRFVFSVLHPCFNSARLAFAADKEDCAGTITTTYFMKQFSYKSSATFQALAIEGQPQAQLVFHRPLEVLLKSGFDAGFILDALLEPSFPASQPAGKSALGWNGNYHEFPPVLICRLRLL